MPKGAATPPREPFAYLSNPGKLFPTREPWTVIVTGLVLVVEGVAFPLGAGSSLDGNVVVAGVGGGLFVPVDSLDRPTNERSPPRR